MIEQLGFAAFLFAPLFQGGQTGRWGGTRIRFRKGLMQA